MNIIKIIRDSHTESPRTWDNLGTIAFKHRNYNIGEEKIQEPIEWLEEKLNLKSKGEYTNERLKTLEAKFFSKFIVLPIYMYEHSGIKLSTSEFSCKWDSGKVGYIYVDPNNTELKGYTKEFLAGRTIEEAVLSILRGEIEILSQYMEEDVYGFEIQDTKGNHIDSCYGFYGQNWAKNGILDHIDAESVGCSSQEELLKLLQRTQIEA